MRSFAILTTAANGTMRTLRERMPVILKEEHWPMWRGGWAGKPSGLMQSGKDGLLHLWPVSRAVDGVRNNGPDLLNRINDPHACLPAMRLPATTECNAYCCQRIVTCTWCHGTVVMRIVSCLPLSIYAPATNELAIRKCDKYAQQRGKDAERPSKCGTVQNGTGRARLVDHRGVESVAGQPSHYRPL